ncbi:class I adenylate-forming enzyme family protein [Lampropedia aestuarii]|uniref:class I adenylate-forming enzyme family protein n=1 Tax=Lampropedia aestuarii TaxID=2562762 RepID=UPI0024690014|nr:AMP-binding protein [Lampropedia aestuarii]MDH5856206.1 AMP-binding protein [Lampropedia aestuarii]
MSIHNSTQPLQAHGPTYLELIRRGAQQHGPRVAIEFQNQTLSFSEVDTLSSRLANAMQAAGMAAHQRVGLLISNGLYSVPVDFACVKAALNRVPLNARISLQEHLKMLTSTGCTHLIYSADLRDRAQALSAALPSLVCLGLDDALPGQVDLMAQAQSASAQAPTVVIKPDDVVLTLFTSGTTGTLKAAQHTQASYAAICRNVMLNLIDVQPDDAMLHAASMIHASGTFVLPFWLRGARTVILSSFEPKNFLHAIEKHRISAINLVPTMLQMLLECEDFSSTNVATLRSVIYGASPMPRATLTKAMAAWGQHRFWQYYGQTEVPLCICVLRPEHHTGDLLSACGQVSLDVEVRLVDENGQDVAAGTPGEVLVRAPSSVLGYYDAPELNAQTFDEQGWVHTRDVGLFDDNGFLHLKDRTSDMIITGGYNVYPREVEDVLLTHPAILECAVFGLPDSKWVEAVTAAVVLRPGHALSQDELIQYALEQLASYKKPTRVLFVDAIAKTAVGKLNRKELKRLYAPQ